MYCAVPDDGKIILKNYSTREWGPEPVRYTLDTARFKPGCLVLLDETEKAVPFQIIGNTLTFVAALPLDATIIYTLRESQTDRSFENTTLTADEKNGAFEMANQSVALRLPSVEKKQFFPPVDAEEATPPILGWANTGNNFIGKAYFQTRRKVASQMFSLIQQGPALVEYEARYTFEPRGEYVWRIRLSPEMPLAIVSEEFDFDTISSGEDQLLLELTSGGQLPENNRRSRNTPLQGNSGSLAPSLTPPEAGMTLEAKLNPGGRWNGLSGYFRFWTDSAESPGLGLVTLSMGAWRRMMAMPVWHKENTGAVLALPISVRPTRWSIDGADDISPFSNHEHDPGLKPTYGRRVWGLYAGGDIGNAQGRYGFIGLDRYKDWILEWPENPELSKYPCAFISPGQLARLKANLDRHPDREHLMTYYLFSGKKEDAIRHAQTVVNRLKSDPTENWFNCDLTHYRQIQMYAFVHLAEDALACPELPEDLRVELRRWLAIYAYIETEPDFNARGAGVHLGNNNMTIGRSLGIAYYAGLLPDHPLYAYWLECTKNMLQYKAATQTAQDGPFIEPPLYQLYQPTRGINLAQNVLRNSGVYDLGKDGYLDRNLDYLANLTMPDPRYMNYRIIPGMGNSHNMQENVWGFALAATEGHNPELAGWFKYINRLTTGNQPFSPGPNGHDETTAHALYYLPDIQENPQPLTTKFMPAYGVVFRNRFNTGNETAMLFRAPVHWSHWYEDPLNVILYGKGAPLSPGTEYQYHPEKGPWENNGIFHNQVKVGRRDLYEAGFRVDNTIQDYGFAPHTDYAMGEKFFPSQLFSDGMGAMSWRRHILFLKSNLPDGDDYFVMRDTFPGGEARSTWWNWFNIETPDRISVDGRAFAKEASINEEPPTESDMQCLHGQTIEMRTEFGASTWFWFDEPRDVRVRMIAEYELGNYIFERKNLYAKDAVIGPGNYRKTVIEVPGKPGQDIFYLVYPRKDGSSVPQVSSPGKGVMAIAGNESADTVFIADEPFCWNQDEIVFTGNAGAVRVYSDRVILTMNSGHGKIGYKGCILEGYGPFEKEIRFTDLNPKVIKMGGCSKKRHTIDLGRGIRITGEGAFAANLDGDNIRIHTDGRAQLMHVTKPDWIAKPQYYIDGTEWMACWTDYPNSGWGTYDNTFLIGLSVPEGNHEILLRNLCYAEQFEREFTPAIAGVILT